MTTRKAFLIGTLLFLFILFNNTNAYPHVHLNPTIEVYSPPPGYIIIIESGRCTHIVVRLDTNIEIVVKDESNEVVFKKENASKGDCIDVSHLLAGEYEIHVNYEFRTKLSIRT